MRTIKRMIAVMCCLILTAGTVTAFADDGFSTSYTYGYDYWEDYQESPDAYRVRTIVDTSSLGLANLDDQAFRKPQSLFVDGKDLYVCDTGNNRIVQLRVNNKNQFKVTRIITTVTADAANYELAETYYSKAEEYEAAISARVAAEEKLAELTGSESEDAETEAPAETEQAETPAEEAQAEEVPAEEAEQTQEETGEGATAENSQPQEEKTASNEEIDAATLALEEAREKEEQIHQEAVEAEERLKASGCNIWQYEAWHRDENGNVVSQLDAPYDVAVDRLGNIFIADTNNCRIVKMDKDCNLIWEYTKPLDATFDQSQNFLPKKIVVDVAERVYSLCQNINKGLVKFEEDGTFSGFIGANEVSVSMTDYIWKRYFQTKEQRAQTANFVPTEYENIYIDEDGFIYATTTVFSEGDLKWDKAKPIRRLNSLGKDILIKNDRYPPIGDLNWVSGSEATGPSKFVDITVLNDGMYVALDRIRGRLFGYDSQGVMLWAFGTKGNVDGAFNGAISIEHMGHDLLVLDQLKNNITVFEPTEYGSTIYSAIETYQKGEYDESAELWQDVLKLNTNYTLAFRGIGQAVMRQNKFSEAMEWFKMAHDRESYGRAFKLYRKEWVEKNIWWIILVVAALLIIPLVIGRSKKMKWEVIMHEHSKVRK